MTGPTTIISAGTHSDHGPEAQDISQGQQGQAADHHDARAAAAQEADGVGWEADLRARGMGGRALCRPRRRRLCTSAPCAAAERRAGSGAPGRGAAGPGERPGWTTRGWELRVRRAGTSVFTEYSLFMMNRHCSTHSHELERGRSIQVMNILRAVYSTQVILFITRPDLETNSSATAHTLMDPVFFLA